MIRKFIAAFVMIFCLSTTAFAFEFIPVDGDTSRSIEGKFKPGDVLRETGAAYGPTNWDMQDSFYKTFARQAARMTALRNLAEFLANAPIKEDNNLITKVLPHDSKVLKLLGKHARVIDVKFLDAGVCEVTMEVVMPADWNRKSPIDTVLDVVNSVFK